MIMIVANSKKEANNVLSEKGMAFSHKVDNREYWTKGENDVFSNHSATITKCGKTHYVSIFGDDNEDE